MKYTRYKYGHMKLSGQNFFAEGGIYLTKQMLCKPLDIFLLNTLCIRLLYTSYKFIVKLELHSK